MRVTFLAHDGFFIELDQVCLLFDWWKGVLPPLSDKPLLVFVSHRHEDHFNPAVFALADRKADIQFLLGSDFHLTPHNLTKWQLSPETAAKCRRCGKHDVFQPLPAVTAETFPSTDEGGVDGNGQRTVHFPRRRPELVALGGRGLGLEPQYGGQFQAVHRTSPWPPRRFVHAAVRLPAENGRLSGT